MPSFWSRLTANARSAQAHPAARLLAQLYISAAVLFYLTSGDAFTLLIQLGLTAWRLAAVLIAVTLTTQPALAWEAPPIPARRRLWLQLGVIALVIAYTLFRSRALTFPELGTVPLIGPLTAWVNSLNFNLANPLLYVGLALVPLLLLGARPAELGLGLPRSREDWRRTGIVVLVLAFMNIAYLIPAVLVGDITRAALGRRLLSSLLQNGFSEEFLMRGALMTRLVRLSGPAWGVVISSVIFGLWHLDTNLPMFGGALLAAVCFSILSQATAGVVYAVALQRGGDLTAPSAVHVLSHFNPF